MVPRKVSRRRQAVQFAADPKMLLPLLTALLTAWASKDRDTKQQSQGDERYTYLVQQQASTLRSLDSLRVRLRGLERRGRGRIGVAWTDTATATEPSPGIAKRVWSATAGKLIGWLWG